MSDSFNDVRRLRQENGELWPRLRIAEARLAEADALLREAVETVETCHDCLRYDGGDILARIDAHLARKP